MTLMSNDNSIVVLSIWEMVLAVIELIPPTAILLHQSQQHGHELQPASERVWCKIGKSIEKMARVAPQRRRTGRGITHACPCFETESKPNNACSIVQID